MAMLISKPKLAVLAALLAHAAAAPLYENPNTPAEGYYGMRRAIDTEGVPSSVNVAGSALSSDCDGLLANGELNDLGAQYCNYASAAGFVTATRSDYDPTQTDAANDDSDDSFLNPFALTTATSASQVTTAVTPLPTLPAPLGEAAAPADLFSYLDDADSVKQMTEGGPNGALNLGSDSTDDDADADVDDDVSDDSSDSSSSSIQFDLVVAHLMDLVNAAQSATALTSTLSLTDSLTSTATSVASATSLTSTITGLATPVTSAAAAATDAALGLFDFSDNTQSSNESEGSDDASVQDQEGAQASEYGSVDA